MKKRRIALWLMTAAFVLSACGGQGSDSEYEAAIQTESVDQDEAFSREADLIGGSTSVQESASDAEESTLSAEEAAAAGERLGHDWRTEEWQIGETGGREHNLYAAEYITGLESDVREEYLYRQTDYEVWGNKLYALDCYQTAEGEAAEYFYYMNCYDGTTGEIRHQALELSWPEEYADNDIRLAGFDIQNEEEWVFFGQIYSEEAPAYLAMHLSSDGEFLSMVDLYPAIQACGGNLSDVPGKYVYVNGQGYYYVIPMNWRKEGEEQRGISLGTVCVLSPDGELITEMQPTYNKYPGFAMKTPDGDPVFRWFGGVDVYTLMYYDTALQEPVRLLYLQEAIWDAKWTGMLTDDGYLYFIDGSGRLNRCDLYTGDRDYCLGYGKLGLGNMPYYVYMLEGPEGEPIIVDTLEGEAVICRLSQEQPEEDPIRLVSLTGNCSFLESQAVLFSKQDLEHPIEVEKPGGDEADYRTRMMAELAAGNGADIYYVSAADMRILYEKGVLADLTGVLSEETLQSVYPGILEGGTIDGQRVGVALEANAGTMLAADACWTENGWKLEELMDMIDAHPELNYPIVQPGSYMDGVKILRLLLFQDLNNTPFLDLKQGTCDFENPLFIRVLELAKRYRDQPITMSLSEDMPQELIEAGDYAAVVLDLRDFPNFSSTMALLGENCHLTGFPADEGAGCYWQTAYYLVVNKNARYPELIHGYLEYLLSENSQNKTLSPVRKDLLGAHIVTVSWDEQRPLQYSAGNGVYYPLETKSDGSSWQEEYEEILSGCVLVSEDTEYIQEIILEEAENYFTGIQNVQAAAGMIQNRVQLYLNERGTVTSRTQTGESKGNFTGNRN